MRTPLLRFVAWFLNQIYGQWAFLYDAVAAITSLGQWWTWQAAADPLLPEGQLLELALGSGRNLLRLTRQGRSIVGLDRSAQMIRIAHNRMLRAGFEPRLVRADVRALPFGDQCFHGVFSTFPTEQTLEAGAVGEAARVLAPGGSAVWVVMAWIRGTDIPSRAAAWLYQITGQSANPDGLEFGQQEVGSIMPVMDVVEQERARVLRLSWTKPRR